MLQATCSFFISFLIRIKEDDKLIQAEGVDSLSEAELREDCRERGMLGLLSVEEMRQQVVLGTVCASLCHCFNQVIEVLVKV